MNNKKDQKIVVEIHTQPSRVGAAAGRQPESKLSDEQIVAIQATVNGLISGFKPPATETTEGTTMALDSIEVELGFKLEAGMGGLLKLMFVDAKGEASITAKATWRRK
jgi:hypothetical protein